MIYDIKLGPVTKLNKRNMTMSKKKLTMRLCRQIMTSMLFFQLMIDLEQSGTRIPEAYSINHTFSLIETFHLTKTGNTTKKSLTQLSFYCFE